MKNQKISQEIQVLINQFKVKNFKHVLSKGKILLKKNPEYVILYNLVGSSCQNIGNHFDAKNYFKEGLKLDPKNIALMNNLAMTHKNLLDYKKAEKIYEEIINLNNSYINAYINLGNLKRDLNKFDQAIKLYEKALVIDEKNPIIYYSLALAHQGIGNFEKANAYSQKTLEFNPNFTRADHLISQSTKYQKDNDHYKSLKKKISKFSSKKFEKIDLLFSLAKAEEDLGDIKTTTKYLIEGNKLKKELLNYNISSEISLLKNIEENFNSHKVKNSSDTDGENVIFILGMPRSGTSLVEQIVTSHSQVFGCGELPILSSIVKNNFIKNEQSLIDEFHKTIQDESFISGLKKEYFKFIENFDHKKKIITDKAPLNFRWIGFIKILFPEAKIIHCIRDPKNNCLSMYKNLFEGGLNFTYDQEDLVKYYKNYLNLMNFWKSKYSDNILDVNYENLISDNDQQIRKIISFCNLDWEENCLTFYKNKTPIKTMSTAQARRPIYKTSLNPFEKFKDYLSILENGF